MGTTSGLLLLVMTCFGILLSVLWLLVPFAVFGIKPILGRLLAEQRHTNALLTALIQQSQVAASSVRTGVAPPVPLNPKA